ncbi:MAG: DUF3365 domain-containing protein [Cyclobacteriaceae bacterium]
MILKKVFSGFYLVVLSIVFFSCGAGTEKRVDRTQYEIERKDREPKKIQEAEILEQALEIGTEIATRSQFALSTQLKKAIEAGGIAHAISFCNVEAISSITDSLEQAYNAKIKRTSLQVRNKSNEPDSMESDILAAYAYNLAEGLELNDNVQRINNETILYTKVISVDNPLCLHCHGMAGNEMKEETAKLIRQLYPNDKAIDYKMGDLRGIWSIRLDSKSVVRSL